jgi:adenylate kinase
LAYALRTAIDRLTDGTDVIVLDNLPWDALQLADLHHRVTRASDLLTVLHLELSDELAGRRGRDRRVCQSCEQDRDMRPRQPAESSAADAGRCRRCGGALSIRDDDTSDVFRRRLDRHRTYVTGLLRVASGLGVTVTGLDARVPAALLIERARTAVESVGAVGAGGAGGAVAQRSDGSDVAADPLIP